MATRLYLRDTPSYEAPTAGKKSTALPNAASTDGNSGNPFENRSLLLVRGETLPDSTIARTSIASTAHVDQYIGRFTSRKLAAQTIAANTWTTGLAALETNAGANSFHQLSVYVWRPSNSSVVGYVWDAHTDLGVEWIAGLDGQVMTFAGGAVTAQLGDVLVMELWRHTAGQTAATAWLQQHNYNAYIDVTGSTTADPASYLETPQNLVFDTAYLPSTVAGVFVETPGFAGPVMDGNGNLYVLCERTELTPAASIYKSTNGGKTWAEMDAANKPTGSYEDFESCGLVLSGTKIKFARMQSGSSNVHLSYHEFNTSGSGTPDTWASSAAIVGTAAGDPTQEQVTLLERSNGDLVVVYGEWVSSSVSRIVYRKKPSGGAWSTATLVHSGAIGSTAVVGAANKIHIFCKEDTSSGIGGSTERIVHLSLSSADVLSSAEAVNDTAITGIENMICRAVYYDDAGVETVYCAWAKSTNFLAGAFVLNDGTPSAEETITDQIVWLNPPDTSPRAPIASLAVDQATKTIYCVYSNNPSNNPSAQAPASEGDLYLATRTHGVGWGTDVELRDGVRVQDIFTNVYTHSVGNGGAKVLGIFYDDANGPFYDEFVISGTPVSYGTASGTTSASPAAFSPAAGEAIYVGFFHSKSTSVNNATIADTASHVWTELANVSFGTDPNVRLQVWRTFAAGGSMDVTCSVTAGADCVMSIVGVTGVGDEGTVVTGTSATGDPSATIAAVQAGSGALGFGGIYNATFAASPSGYTEVNQVQSTCRMQAVFDTTSPGTTLAWTSTSFYGVAVAFEIKAAEDGYTIAAAAAAFAVAGQATGLLFGYRLTAQAAAFSLAGSATGLLRGYPLSAAAGAYAIVGSGAGLTATNVALAATVTPYTLAGPATGLAHGHLLTAGAGSFALVGPAVTLTIAAPSATTLTAGTGSFSVVGPGAVLARGRFIPAAAGAYVWAGQAVVLTQSVGAYTLTAGTGAFSVLRNSARLLKPHGLYGHAATPGTFNSDAVMATRGTVLTFAAPGEISHVWVYRTGSEGFSTGRDVGIYSATGLTITLTGNYAAEFRNDALNENIDARTAVFHQSQEVSGDYPFNITGASGNTGLKFLGGTMLGGVPSGDWRTLYDLQYGNSAALRINNCPNCLIDGWTFEKDPALSGDRFVWDGIRTNGTTTGYMIQNILMNGCRDDAFELENNSGGTIKDSRFFDCFVFVGTDGDDATGKTLTIENCLVSMGLHSYKGSLTHQSPFKTRKPSGNPAFVLLDVVIAIRDPNHEGEERLQIAFAGMTATNCYFLNLSDTPLPSNYPPRPAGMSTLQGQSARDYWDNRVATWSSPSSTDEELPVLLASGIGGAEGAAGWKRIALDVPLPVETGIAYIAAARCQTYRATSNVFVGPQTNNQVTGVATGNTTFTGFPIGNGRYTYGASFAPPTSTLNASSYFIDVDYTAQITDFSFSVAAAAYTMVAYPVGLPVAAFTLEAEVSDFVLSGTSVGFSSIRSLSVDVSGFAWAGPAVAMVRGYTMPTGTAAFALVGPAIWPPPVSTFVMSAGLGGFVLIGPGIELRSSHTPLDAEIAEYGFTGMHIGFRFSRNLAAGAAAYAVAGPAAGLRAARRVIAAAGAFVRVGGNATFVIGLPGVFVLSADTGSLASAGPAVALARTHVLGAGTGAMTLACQPAGMTRVATLTAATGAFVLGRPETALAQGYRLGAATLAMALDGYSATLTSGETMTADVAEFALVMSDAALIAVRRMAAAPGAFALVRAPAGLNWVRIRILLAAPKAFTLAGKPAGLDWAGPLVLSAEPKAFTIAAPEVVLRFRWKMDADVGEVVLTGAAAAMMTEHLIRADRMAGLIYGKAVRLRRGHPRRATSANANRLSDGYQRPAATSSARR